ncbi:CU044_2847 family protein [Kitasatospora sp. NPDC004531]
MADYVEFALDPGVSVRVRAYPAPPAAAALADTEADEELPPGYSGAVPVSSPARAADRVAALSRDALRFALSPLGPLLQEVHDTLAAVPNRPQEISVEFGVQLGSDLKLGIVGGSAEASLTISASWKLAEPAAPAQTPPGQPHRPA